MMFGSVAHAQWFTVAKGSDVFGNAPVVTAVRNNNGNGLTVQCAGDDPIQLAYVMPASQEILNGISNLEADFLFDLLVKVDSGTVQKFDAQLKAWNTLSMAFVFTGRTPQLAALIRSIGKAKQTINVGVEVMGQKVADTFGVLGSTSAMNTVIKNCNLDQIKDNDTPDLK